MSKQEARQRLIEKLDALPDDDLVLAEAVLERLTLTRDIPVGPLSRLVGMRLTHREDGYCRAECEVGPELYNIANVLHGSVAHALIDVTMGGAAYSALGMSGNIPKIATIEIKINYLKAVKEGTLITETRVVRAGRKIVFLDSTVVNGDGELVATGSGSFYVF